jgi:hypothetical protein
MVGMREHVEARLGVGTRARKPQGA